MFILGNFIFALARVVDVILLIAYWLILVRALISWVNPDPDNPIVQFLYKATEPILEPIRRFLPRMPLDISPIIAFLFIIFMQRFLVATLMQFGYRLQSS